MVKNATDFTLLQIQKNVQILMYLKHSFKPIRSQDIPEKDNCMAGARDSTLPLLWLNNLLFNTSSSTNEYLQQLNYNRPNNNIIYKNKFPICFAFLDFLVHEMLVCFQYVRSGR
jgi:hypothetical protein